MVGEVGWGARVGGWAPLLLLVMVMLLLLLPPLLLLLLLCVTWGWAGCCTNSSVATALS